jgi:hypothetical protein
MTKTIEFCSIEAVGEPQLGLNTDQGRLVFVGESPKATVVVQRWTEAEDALPAWDEVKDDGAVERHHAQPPKPARWERVDRLLDCEVKLDRRGTSVTGFSEVIENEIGQRYSISLKVGPGRKCATCG